MEAAYESAGTLTTTRLGINYFSNKASYVEASCYTLSPNAIRRQLLTIQLPLVPTKLAHLNEACGNILAYQ